MPSGPSTHYPLSENAVADLVDTIKSRPDRRDELVALLPENAAIYAGRGTNATIRLKGYILAAFEQVGAPPAAMPYILDELQNGRDAYTTAAAAKALRGLDAPSAKVLSSLLKAVDNIRYVDDAISFARYKPQWPVQERTTALEEIFSSFAWLGSMARPALPDLELLQTDPTLSDRARGCIARALDTIRAAPQHVEAEDCCGAPLSIDSPMQADRCSMPPTHVVLEDQDGRSLTYAEFFSRTPSIIVFFYTRCDNPNKCSLSITKLARLQQAIALGGLAGQLKTAAITYDPGFDSPLRLRAYGENRGMTFGENARMFRAPSDFDALRDYFQLGVNFGDVLVNRHRIELYLVDSAGKIAETFTRLQWDPAVVLGRAKLLLTRPAAARALSEAGAQSAGTLGVGE